MLNTSPFAALYDHNPWHWEIEATSTWTLELKEWLEERKPMQQVLTKHLHRARHIMKVQADKWRMLLVICIGISPKRRG